MSLIFSLSAQLPHVRSVFCVGLCAGAGLFVWAAGYWVVGDSSLFCLQFCALVGWLCVELVSRGDLSWFVANDAWFGDFGCFGWVVLAACFGVMFLLYGVLRFPSPCPFLVVLGVWIGLLAVLVFGRTVGGFCVGELGAASGLAAASSVLPQNGPAAVLCQVVGLWVIGAWCEHGCVGWCEVEFWSGPAAVLGVACTAVLCVACGGFA
ncbi:hypothetical protein Patl1_32850 [Pistacia atlantica]|uniref:Uncharacterized protein n=1 Tax=Pistacia atlantica TaxID=434234 RepID=A0ACC1ARZ3_9ROSI|nr:hypothetical protein Patl1_32850 [Pistacia atlantica]